MRDMKDEWRSVCDAYLRAFCERHGYDPAEAFWVGDDPGTLACAEEVFVDMRDLRYDVDNEVPESRFEEWYGYEEVLHGLELEFRFFKDRREFRHIKYAAFCAGAPLPYSEEEIEGFRDELRRKTVDKSTDYIEIMSGIIGRDILERVRENTVAWARYIVADALAKEGYPTGRIGKKLHLHHSTVHHGLEQVKKMLEFPSMYYEEKEIYDKFHKYIEI